MNKFQYFLDSSWFGIRNSSSRFIWQNISNTRYADVLSKILMVRKTIFGKDIDLDKTILLDSNGRRITNEYCENIINDMRKRELIK